MHTELENLKQQFLDRWPINKLQEMQLNEYTNTDRKDSFCYWVEHITRDLGSIVGGSSYKFGIYKRNDISKPITDKHRKTDGVYAWHAKYGDSKEKAFKNIKQIITDIAVNAENNNLKAIDTIDLGNAFKWKIAFLYGNYNVLNIFKVEALKFVASNLHISFERKTPISFLHREILKQQQDKEFYNFYHTLWNQYAKGLLDIKQDFANWLNTNTHDSYRNYLGDTITSIINRLNEIDNFFDEVDFFLVNPENIIQHIDTILLLVHKIEREKRPDFVEYDLKNSNGIPKALLGKNNYIKFLKEKFEIKEIENTKINMIENLVEEFKQYLNDNTSLARRSIEIYVANFNLFISSYTKGKQINHLTQNDYRYLINFHYNDYQIETIDNGEDSGKGYKYFIQFITSKISYNKITNQILYGPPGTGKTYATKELAVNLISPKSIYANTPEDRIHLIKHYNKLVEQGQIVFTTFHQSMSYEDFIEGIKPKTDDNNKVIYEIEDGIFKKIANTAKGIKGLITNNDNTDFKNVNYFKMSVGGKNRKYIHDWCLENNYIALGYGTNNDLSELFKLDESLFRKQFPQQYPEITPYSITAVSAFNYWMKKGDIVLVSLGNHIIDAIGVITGDYEYIDNGEIPFKHFRKVKWLATNLEADPSLFVDKNISQQTIYQFDNNDIKVKYLEETFTVNKNINIPKDYVLIIDEINRGNVSAIFGELITLLEPDKRLGQNEELTVTLPYSKSTFGVPSNLHIIGTMNTADRSVEALDTALRRRFEFKEIMPNPNLLEGIEFNGFNLKELLGSINERIALLLNKDYTIGHSYFITINSGDNEALALVFNNKIIPLLQEYFYGDYGKIGLVLGEGFVEKKKNKNIAFASFEYENSNDFKTSSYELKDINAENIIEAVHKTLGIKTVITTTEQNQFTPEFTNA